MLMVSVKANYYVIQKKDCVYLQFSERRNTGQTRTSTILQCLTVYPNSAVNPFTCIKKSFTVKVISVDMEECSTFYSFCYWIKDFAIYSKALEGFLMKENDKSVFQMFPLYDKQLHYNGKTTGYELEFMKLYYVE